MKKVILQSLILLLASTTFAEDYGIARYNTLDKVTGSGGILLFFPDNDDGKNLLRYGPGTLYHKQSKECASINLLDTDKHPLKKISCPKHVLEKLELDKKMRKHHDWASFKNDLKNCLQKEDLICLRGLISPNVRISPNAPGFFLKKEKLLRNELEKKDFKLILNKLNNFKKFDTGFGIYYTLEVADHNIYIGSIESNNEKFLIIKSFTTSSD
ncbi:hypothetical protein [Halobacteriovorax sp. CON-3]|uniref:hypothetical protein n=1 Tax=Halobacteriovorax sp. CON-3 TaxID=3157710 RepID=UPI00371BD769